MIEYDELCLYIFCVIIGRNVTILRGCRQSAIVSAVSSGGTNQVDISVSSQSCSTNLCNTGNGLRPSSNLAYYQHSTSATAISTSDSSIIILIFFIIWRKYWTKLSAANRKAFYPKPRKWFSRISMCQLRWKCLASLFLRYMTVLTAVQIIFTDDCYYLLWVFQFWPLPPTAAKRRRRRDPKRSIVGSDKTSGPAPIAWLRAPHLRKDYKECQINPASVVLWCRFSSSTTDSRICRWWWFEIVIKMITITIFTLFAWFLCAFP